MQLGATFRAYRVSAISEFEGSRILGFRGSGALEFRV